MNFMFYTPTQRRSRVDSLGADVLNERGINKTEISLHFGRFRTCVRKAKKKHINRHNQFSFSVGVESRTRLVAEIFFARTVETKKNNL